MHYFNFTFNRDYHPAKGLCVIVVLRNSAMRAKSIKDQHSQLILLHVEKGELLKINKVVCTYYVFAGFITGFIADKLAVVIM